MDTLALPLSVDYRSLFEAVPGLNIALMPNSPIFTAVAASDAYLQAAMRDRESIIGRGLFEVFKDNPDDPHATGVANLRASLEHVLRNRTVHTMAVQRYDVQLPASMGGEFVVRYWSPVNSPVLDRAGNVVMIIHSVMDVTDLHNLEARTTEETRHANILQHHTEQLSQERLQRSNSLQEANDRLNEAILERQEAEGALKEEAETLETINRLGRTIAAELDLKKLVQAVTDTATQLTGAQFGAFFYNVIGSRGESYQLYTIAGVPPEAFSQFPMPRNTELFAHTFNGVGVMRLDDVRKDERYGKNPPHSGMPKGHLPVVSYLAVPVISRTGEVLGGLFFGHEQPGRFTLRHERLLVGLAAQTAIAIDNARLYEDVKERETRLRLATEAADVGTWDFDPLTGMLSWDSRCKAFFGLSPDADVNYDVFLRGLHPEDRDRTHEAVQRAMDPENPADYDIEYRTIGIEDSKLRWAAAKGRAVFGMVDGERRAVRFIGTVIDITGRKQFEVEHARSAAIVETSEDAIVSKDLNGIVTSWNQAAERMYGWPAEEIIGRSKSLVIPPDLPNELSEILRKIRMGERIEHYETRRIRRDGTTFEVAISVSPIKDVDGHLIGAATIVRDITERKRFEREFIRKREEAEALSDRLQRAMREIHHRIKNNLQIVSAMIDMQVIEHMEDETVPLKELQRLSGHVRTLAAVHDLLTKSIREDEQEQRVSSVRVIDRLLQLLTNTLGGRSIRSQVDDVELLSKQAVALSLAINELVSNAAKHAEGSIEVQLRTEERRAELCVCDDGAGFPDGFDPVARANTGLELVLGIVQTDLSGKIYFENGDSGGACVRITFSLPDLGVTRNGNGESAF